MIVSTSPAAKLCWLSKKVIEVTAPPAKVTDAVASPPEPPVAVTETLPTNVASVQFVVIDESRSSTPDFMIPDPNNPAAIVNISPTWNPDPPTVTSKSLTAPPESVTDASAPVPEPPDRGTT